MNDVLAITDTTGTIVGNYEYDAWGKVLTADTSIAQQNPLRYRGYYYDNETGYYYLQSRYYDANICRFINSDIPEIAQMSKDIHVGTNLFAYCNNNAVNNSDSDGKIGVLSMVLVGALVGFVVSFVLSAIISRVTNPNISGKALWSGALIDGIGGAISGAVAVLPCGTLIQAVVNAIIGGATYIAYCKVCREPVYKSQLAFAVAIGAVSGVAGGKGILAKAKGKVNVSSVMKETNKVIAREARRANRKYAAKAIKAAKNRLSSLIAEKMWKTFSKYAGVFVLAKYSNNKITFR